MKEERNEVGVNGGEKEQSFGLGVDLCQKELDCLKKKKRLAQRYCRLQLIMKYTYYSKTESKMIGDPNKKELDIYLDRLLKLFV